MKGHCILSHGFESGPDATKVTALAEVAESLGWTHERPDYTGFDAQTDVSALGNVMARREHLRARIAEALPKGPVVLAGSSLGSYISAQESLLASVAGLFLMAPPVFRELQDASLHLDAAAVPISIVHPWRDELIPAQHVIDWAAPRRARLLLVDDTHRLSDHVETSAQAFGQFLQSLR